jgi:hypothetical protein
MDRRGRRIRMPEKLFVKVRWQDAYLEAFVCIDVRHSGALLWLVLDTGENRHIPLSAVRWFSVEIEKPLG